MPRVKWKTISILVFARNFKAQVLLIFIPPWGSLKKSVMQVDEQKMSRYSHYINSSTTHTLAATAAVKVQSQ